jgi:hypothetical protein
MSCYASIFFDFNLPNAATWFYFSLLLAIALFFKFSRLLSVRNLDILMLFSLVPGFLLLLELRQPAAMSQPQRRAVQIVVGAVQAASTPGTGVINAVAYDCAALPVAEASPFAPWLGYLWLLCASLGVLLRCLFDLGLVRRPALTPNLNLSGLAWLGIALMVCLVAVAIRKPVAAGTVGRRSAAVDETQRRAEGLVRHEIGVPDVPSSNTSFWVECTLAVACHLAIVVGLWFVGWRHFQDHHIGVAVATLYLLLPYTAYHVDQVHHLLPAAFLLWAFAAYRYPCVSGLLLGMAAGTGYFPALLLPAWSSFYWRRGTWRFLAAFSLACGLFLAVIGLVLWLEGELTPSIRTALSLADWQPWKGPSADTPGLWTGVAWAWAYRLPVFIAYCAFVIATAFWPAPKNLAHLLALSTVVLVGIQFWYANQGGVYVLWYLPLLLLVLFRPNLADREALPIRPDADWLGRVGHRLWRWLTRWRERRPAEIARLALLKH